MKMKYFKKIAFLVLLLILLSTGKECFAQAPAPQKAVTAAPVPVNAAQKPANPAVPSSNVKPIGNGRGGSYDDEDESGIKKIRKRKQRAKRTEDEELRQWQLNTYKKQL